MTIPSGLWSEIDGNKVPLTYIGAGHVMGTYRMGTRAKDSVVDSFQRCWDHRICFWSGAACSRRRDRQSDADDRRVVAADRG